MTTTTISEYKKEVLFHRIAFFAKAGNLLRANFFEFDALLAEIGSQIRKA